MLKRISISDLIRADALEPGTQATIFFEDGSQSQLYIPQTDSVSFQSFERQQTFEIEHRRRRNGSRRYFKCPVTGRRLQHLFWLPRQGWTTRTAENLTYSSQTTVGPNAIPTKNGDGYLRFKIEVVS